jgi:hypothetical protein
MQCKKTTPTLRGKRRQDVPPLPGHSSSLTHLFLQGNTGARRLALSDFVSAFQILNTASITD